MKKNKIQKDKKLKELVNQKDVYLLHEYIVNEYARGFSCDFYILPNKDECFEIVGTNNIVFKGRYWCLVDVEDNDLTIDQINKLEEMGMWLLDDMDNLYE